MQKSLPLKIQKKINKSGGAEKYPQYPQGEQNFGRPFLGISVVV